jgi:hypothetical protein
MVRPTTLNGACKGITMSTSCTFAFAFVIFPLSLVATARGEQNERVTHERIIGDIDLIPVEKDGQNIPDKYQKILNAFGLMNEECTATHIGHGYALTAGHCVKSLMNGGKIENSPCDDTTIQWGLRKGRQPFMKSNCTRIIFAEFSSKRDFALLQLDNVPPISVEVDLSSRSASNTVLTIFGHPQGRPLEWSQTCMLKPNLPNLSSDQFRHECDTEAVNSGSALLDNLSLKVIGVHNGFFENSNYATFIVGTPLETILRNILPHH